MGVESRSIELSQKPSAKRASQKPSAKRASQKPSAKRANQWPIMYLIRFRWSRCTGVGGG